MNPQEFVSKRHNTISLYSQRSTRIDLPHQKIIRAVLAAYGKPPDQSADSGLCISNEKILECLLALNLARVDQQKSQET